MNGNAKWRRDLARQALLFLGPIAEQLAPE